MLKNLHSFKFKQKLIQNQTKKNLPQIMVRSRFYGLWNTVNHWKIRKEKNSNPMMTNLLSYCSQIITLISNMLNHWNFEHYYWVVELGWAVKSVDFALNFTTFYLFFQRVKMPEKVVVLHCKCLDFFSRRRPKLDLYTKYLQNLPFKESKPYK